MVSSKDVAKVAGVSQATVSRVMNNPLGVTTETREKVLRAMEELKYTPNQIARSLVLSSTNTIGLIAASLNNSVFVETTQASVDVATRYGYQTIVYFIENESELDEALAKVIGQSVDGILCAVITLNEHHQQMIEKSGIPCVYSNNAPHDRGSFVILDNIGAGERITNHVIELGHERIAFISEEQKSLMNYERQVGYEKAMKMNHLSLSPEMIFTIQTSPAMLKRNIDRIIWGMMLNSNPPSAIIFANDELALLGMDTIQAMGLHIPEDVSIAGIDDIKISSHGLIQLTTVRPKFSIGELAAENLMALIGKSGVDTKDTQIKLIPELVIRNTTISNHKENQRIYFQK